MQSLNLGWCEGVTDEGVMSLAFGCPDLRALDLCGCVLITGICLFGCVHVALDLFSCGKIPILTWIFFVVEIITFFSIKCLFRREHPELENTSKTYAGIIRTCILMYLKLNVLRIC